MKRYLWIVIGFLNVCSSALASYQGELLVITKNGTTRDLVSTTVSKVRQYY